MQALRRTTWMRRAMAAAMALVFLQGIASTFAHFEFEEHYYCAEHDRVTHDQPHADAHDELDRHAAVSPTDQPHRQPSDEETPRRDNCLWMSWVQSSSYASPDFAPELLNLPPPADTEQLAARRAHHLSTRPVSLRHVSPINSPPSA